MFTTPLEGLLSTGLPSLILICLYDPVTSHLTCWSYSFRSSGFFLCTLTLPYSRPALGTTKYLGTIQIFGVQQQLYHWYVILSAFPLSSYLTCPSDWSNVQQPTSWHCAGVYPRPSHRLSPSIPVPGRGSPGPAQMYGCCSDRKQETLTSQAAS